MKINKWLILIFILFFCIEIYSQFTWNVLGDDTTYYAMGELTSQGLIPYKDFFYAHPPLQMIFYGIIFFLGHTFGITVILLTKILKIFTIILTIVNFYLIYLMVEKEFNKKIALTAVTIGLFAPTVLFNASYGYGLDVAMLFFLLGLKWEKNAFKQNLMFVLASMYRFHIIFLIIGYTIYKLAIQDWQHIKRIVWFINWFLIINGILIFLMPNYLTDVFLYHATKPHANLGTLIMVETVLKINYFIFLLPLILLLFYIKSSDERILKYIMIPLPFLFYFLKIIFFGYYFMLIIPFLAVIGAYTINKIDNKLIYIPLILFVISGAYNYAISENDIPKLDIFKDRMVTGEPSMVSYMVLLNGNKVMDNQIDTNSMMFEAGFRNMTEYLSGIMYEHPIVIAKQDEGVYPRIKEFRDYVNSSCKFILLNQKYRVYDC